jgi:hypothetical protein
MSWQPWACALMLAILVACTITHTITITPLDEGLPHQRDAGMCSQLRCSDAAVAFELEDGRCSCPASGFSTPDAAQP